MNKNKIIFYGEDYSKVDFSSHNELDSSILDKVDVIFEKFIKEVNNSLIKKEFKPVYSPYKKEKEKDAYEIVTIFNNEYYYGGLVGAVSKVITLEDKKYDVTLEIKSRFDSKDYYPYFLLTLLNKGKLEFLKNTKVDSSNESYYEFLMIFIFKEKLKIIKNKGLYRSYMVFKNNDQKLKGSIDIARHIKENILFNNGNIAYNYRENSIDNYLNRLIIYTYKYLKNKYPNLVNSVIDSDYEISRIFEEINYGISVNKYDLKTIINKNLTPISHPYFIEYDEIRRVCLDILKDDSISFFNENNEDKNKVEGFLFYIPDLWEIYLEKSLDIELEGQPKFKVLGAFNIRPDFVLPNKNNPVMVLDAKFKKDRGEFIRIGTKSDSILNDYTKCIRDMNAFNVHKVGVIFPVNDLYLEPKKFEISKLNTEDEFFAFPLDIPLIKEDILYEERHNKLTESIKRLDEYISALIEE